MRIQEIIKEHLVVTTQTLELQKEIETIAMICVTALKQGNKILLAGNGGSAADAQHIAAEMTGRFVLDRQALPAIALTTDTSALTAISNDYGFEQVFSRQLAALGQIGDVFIGISTSGNSPNIINAMEVAKNKGLTIVALTGNDGGKIKNIADFSLIIPSKVTARIQEMHILVGHIICEYIDTHLS